MISELKQDGLTVTDNMPAIYKERILSAKRPSRLRPKDEIKSNKQIDDIKKDLFKLNKNFLEEFKNYQIIKLNIKKANDVESQTDNVVFKRKQRVFRNSFAHFNDNSESCYQQHYSNHSKNYYFLHLADPESGLNIIEKSLLQEEHEDLK